ncbi:MAG: sigma-70 family RNA polymerase sigma factor [Planctomycetota bacterium]|nr:MAG: sigma-70 family RNA polymerase sigma factor [Planctomycetota bacterium]
MSSTPSTELEHLLRHAAWVRALARGLVADEATADDLVQETWVAALRRPPRSSEAAAGWLARVARNAAAALHRGEAHRRARQARAARSEAQPSVEDSLERAALQRRLVEAVWELREIHRTPVLLYYFDGLPPRAIARRLQITPEAVRQRLHRGLEQLRLRLERDYGPEQARARLAALALSGGLLVSTGLKIAAAAVVAAALGLWWLRAGAESEAGGVAAVAPAPAAHGKERPAEEAALPGAEAARAPAVAVAAPAPGGGAVAAPARSRLKVHVQEENTGLPLAGIAFHATWSLAGTDEWQFAEGATDGGGDWVLEMSGAALVPYLSAMPGPDVPVLDWYEEAPRPMPAGETLEINLTVPQPGAAEGVVLDLEGRPVAGAEVLAWHRPYRGQVRWVVAPHRSALSDGAGRFVLEGLRGQFHLAARAAGALPASCVTGKLGSLARATGIELRVCPARSLRGRVVDSAGRPIAGVELRAVSAYRVFSKLQIGDGFEVADGGGVELQAASGADGGFALDLPAGERTLYARWHGHPDQQVLVADAQDWVEIVFDDGLEVRGVVLDAAGRPIAGATWHCKTRSDSYGHSGITDETGGFQFLAREPDSDAVLIAHAAGFAAQVLRPLRLAPGMDPVEVRLEPARVLAGRVLDAGGAPVAGARLRLAGAVRVPPPGESDPQTGVRLEEIIGAGQGTTDPAGRFRFDRLNPGRYRIRVLVPGTPGAAAVLDAEAGSEDLVLVLGDGLDSMTSLRGRVLDAVTGAPLPRFDIGVSRLDGPYILGDVATVEDAAGRFEVRGVDASEFAALSARADGYAAWRWERAAEDFPREWDIRLWPARAVEVLVLDSAGKPLPWSGITATTEDGREVAFRVPLGTTPKAVADENGRASLLDVPACRLALRVLGLENELLGEFTLDLRQPLGGVQELRIGTEP